MPIIEIFKAGKRQDANGQLVEITESDLNKVATHYDPKFHEAPLVIGHPKTDAPAYGWVKSLHVDDGVLKAEVENIDPQFAEWVKTGKYKKISSAFYLPNSSANPVAGGFYLRHVGFLGATPPAVKGLADPTFNDADNDWCQFEESTQQVQGDTMSAETQAELDALRAENAQLKAEKAASQKAQSEKENAEFAEGLIKEGKLPPKQKDELLGLLNTETDTAEFSENDFKRRLKAFLTALPAAVAFSETATKDNAETPADDTVEYAEGTNPASIDMDKKVRAYAKKHNCSYTDAFNAVIYQ